MSADKHARGDGLGPKDSPSGSHDRGDMATRGIGQSMIERYARTRGERLFHSEEGGYLMLQDSARGHFPVHMRADGSVVEFSPRWSKRFARTERNSQFSITDDADFETFGRFVDSSRASAAAVFEEA